MKLKICRIWSENADFCVAVISVEPGLAIRKRLWIPAFVGMTNEHFMFFEREHGVLDYRIDFSLLAGLR